MKPPRSSARQRSHDTPRSPRPWLSSRGRFQTPRCDGSTPSRTSSTGTSRPSRATGCAPPCREGGASHAAGACRRVLFDGGGRDQVDQLQRVAGCGGGGGRGPGGGPRAGSRTAPDPFVGNVLAAGSALAWAFTVTGYRWLARRGVDHGPIAAAAACGNLLVFLVCLPGALPLTTGRATDWLIVVYLGVFQLGLAYLFLSRAITRVPALEASLFLLVEPVLSPVWAWLAHGETPGPLAVVGGAVILTATALKAWTDNQMVAA